MGLICPPQHSWNPHWYQRVFGDSQEAGCGLSAYAGAELQLPNPYRHHKHFPGTVISACVAPTKPQTFLGLPSGHAVILCDPFNTAIKASCPKPH